MKYWFNYKYESYEYSRFCVEADSYEEAVAQTDDLTPFMDQINKYSERGCDEETQYAGIQTYDLKEW